MFLYIDPLKQGLKPFIFLFNRLDTAVFIHRSIKTRIETNKLWQIKEDDQKLFLYIDPLKQGLKLSALQAKDAELVKSFYT